MAYLVNGILYVPVTVPPPQTESCGTDTVEDLHLIKNDKITDTVEDLYAIRSDLGTQTEGLRKPFILPEALMEIVRKMRDFPNLQCRTLQWGKCSTEKAI